MLDRKSIPIDEAYRFDIVFNGFGYAATPELVESLMDLKSAVYSPENILGRTRLPRSPNFAYVVFVNSPLRGHTIMSFTVRP